jgi:hypothetical protein
MVVTHDRQERQPITAPTRNWRFSASQILRVQNGENRHPLIAASVGGGY